MSMRVSRAMLLGVLAVAGVTSPGWAKVKSKGKDETPAAAARPVEPEPELTPEQREAARQLAQLVAFEASLKPQGGRIELGKGLATLNLPEGFRYLDAKDTDRVLQTWGNPPSPDTLGMFYPAEGGLFGERSWAVIVTYSEDGHVSDDDAEDIDYAALLEEMKAGNAEANKERSALGLRPLVLVGWAEPPHYDKAEHKLYWAKELKADDADASSLNYAIRALGREGVLELNAVSDMTHLADIKRQMKDVLGFVSFAAGNTYADFNPSVDKVAAYGIGALIAGKVAAKAGLLKGLFALLLASKKLLVVAVVALGAALKSLLGRRKAAPPTVVDNPEPPVAPPNAG